MRRLFYVFCFVVPLTQTVYSQNYKQQQKRLEIKRKSLFSDITKYNELLQQEQNNRKNALDQIDLLSQKIVVNEKIVSVMNSQETLMALEIEKNTKYIDNLKEELVLLKKDYASMIQKSFQSKSKQSRLMFLFSSESFLQAYKRIQYLKQYANYRKVQAESIKEKTQNVVVLNDSLNAQLEKQRQMRLENERMQSALKHEKQNFEGMVLKIRQQEKKYFTLIKEKKQEADRLNNQIEDLIKKAIIESNKARQRAQEKLKQTASTKSIKKTGIYFKLSKESQALADKFFAQKGRLIWPVDKGIKVRGFGEYADPIYPSVKYNSNGVTIATKPETKVFSVFEGEVSSIILVPGGKKAVQIRHGNYISTYYNLSDIYVKKGDFVKEKATIGEIFTDPYDDKTELKFFLYEDTQKLNPEDWIYNM